MNVMTISARLDAIRTLPINELDKRQGKLVALAADIVNHETENGKLTVAEGNSALERMPYWTSLNEYMRGAGFTRLGNGHFSAVYSHHLLPQKVIKVGFKKEDSGAAYAAFCRMHQGRQGIPTIHDIQRHAGCYTVVLDHLNPVPLDHWGDMDDEYDAYSQFDLVRDILEYEAVIEDELCDELHNELRDTANEIRKFFTGIARFDLHANNVMLDRNDNVVITDPVSFGADNGLPKEDFIVDPEVLLSEIEAMNYRRLIERCKRRKESRNPNGEFQVGRKRRAKIRKERKARSKDIKRAVIKVRHETRKELRNEQLAKDWLGETFWHKCWLNNAHEDLKNIELEAAESLKVHDNVAIQAGKALHVDRMLDNMLMG
ncbi:serine/threonine kinase [Yersinia phage vB_YenP_Rambo]|uniref:Serine/threonine kinase n=1 Tax=Yersinia phage vB_YenP_Rambo TaxID=2880894 RepID=A0AC61TNS5_9CAUD|nr:serine/threonine kinase [Yersinia phage vB_YenP_Rambo]